MSLLGVHALVWVGDWSESSARTAIESTRETGFDLIEIPLLDPSTVDAAMTRKLLDDNGLQATCSLGLSADTDVSSEDPAVVRRGREVLASALEVAAGFGSLHMCGVLYSALRKYEAPLSAAGRAHVVETIAWLGEEAAKVGVPVSLEVVNRYETNVANTAAQMVELIEESGAGVKVHLDTYHMNIEENGFVSPVKDTGSKIGYVHIGESHRGYLGTGSIDFDSFFGALREIDYDGPIAFESFSSAVVHPQLSNTLAVWRNLWEDGKDLATHARQYIADRLA